MIWGRPTNLWLGLTTAASGAIAATLIVLGFDAQAVGTIAGVWQGVLGAIILLVASQPPTLLPGDKVTVITPTGTPNATVTPSDLVTSIEPDPVAPDPSIRIG